MNLWILDAWGRLRGNQAGYPTVEDAIEGLREWVDTDPVNHPDEYPFEIRNANSEVVKSFGIGETI